MRTFWRSGISRLCLSGAVLILGALLVAFAAPGAGQTGIFTRIMLNEACEETANSGSPEGVLVGDPCDVYQRSDGPPFLYRKHSGVGTNTGWIASLSASGVGNAALAWTSATTLALVDRDTLADPSADNPVILTIAGQERILTAAQAVVLPTDLDTGSETAGTDYYIWATRDGLTTGIALKFSASKTAPTGLTTKLLVGAGHNNPSSDLLSNSVWSLALQERNKEGMVKAGDVWIDIYESSVWTTLTGGTQKGASGDDYGCEDTGNDCSGLYARSVYSVTPARYLTWFQAARFCAASGKHLATDSEWQTQALGTPDNSTDCNITTSGPEGAGTRTACKSWANTYDSVGNLWEWTGNHWAGTRTLASPVAETPGTAVGWGPGLIDTIWNVRGAAFADGNGSGYADNIPAAGLRGGGWDYGTGAGVFSLALYYSPWGASSDIGFRCAGR